MKIASADGRDFAVNHSEHVVSHSLRALVDSMQMDLQMANARLYDEIQTQNQRERSPSPSRWVSHSLSNEVSIRVSIEAGIPMAEGEVENFVAFTFAKSARSAGSALTILCRDTWMPFEIRLNRAWGLPAWCIILTPHVL